VSVGSGRPAQRGCYRYLVAGRQETYTADLLEWQTLGLLPSESHASRLRQSMALSIAFDSSWGSGLDPSHKSIPAWQKCILTRCPVSNPSSTRPDQLNLRWWVSFLNGRLQPRGLLPRALSGADTSVNAGRLLAGNEYLFPAEVWPITGSAPRAPYRPRCGCGSHIGSSVRRARSPARLGHRHTPSGGESE